MQARFLRLGQVSSDSRRLTPAGGKARYCSPCTDVAIRIGALRNATLHARAVCNSRLRLVANPAYLKARGKPKHVSALTSHSLLAFTQPDTFNQWPLRHALGDTLWIEPGLRAPSGETLLKLALAVEGIACLADYMTQADRGRGDLVQVLMQAPWSSSSPSMRSITATRCCPRALHPFLTTSARGSGKRPPAAAEQTRGPTSGVPSTCRQRPVPKPGSAL